MMGYLHIFFKETASEMALASGIYTALSHSLNLHGQMFDAAVLFLGYRCKLFLNIRGLNLVFRLFLKSPAVFLDLKGELKMVHRCFIWVINPK